MRESKKIELVVKEMQEIGKTSENKVGKFNLAPLKVYLKHFYKGLLFKLVVICTMLFMMAKGHLLALFPVFVYVGNILALLHDSTGVLKILGDTLCFVIYVPIIFMTVVSGIFTLYIVMTVWSLTGVVLKLTLDWGKTQSYYLCKESKDNQ